MWEVLMATKWGIVSAGRVCHDFVTVIQSIPDKGEHEVVAIASRSLQRAQAFAKSHNIPKAYGSYEELAKDADVDVVYVGTKNLFHFDVGKLLLENGKPILMEKCMTLNLKQTKALIDLAKQKNLFLMEAVWCRFSPAYRHLMDEVRKGTIGDIIHVDAQLGYPLPEDEKLNMTEIDGGSVVDLGVYTINIVLMMFNGEKPSKIASVGHLNQNGFDIAFSASLLYTKNRTASISHHFDNDLANEAVITGTKGSIKICLLPTTIFINGKKFEYPLPETIRPCNDDNTPGLQYEAVEVRQCLKRGAIESSIMPLKDSETMVEIMDEIRKQLGVKYSVD